MELPEILQYFQVQLPNGIIPFAVVQYPVDIYQSTRRAAATEAEFLHQYNGCAGACGSYRRAGSSHTAAYYDHVSVIDYNRLFRWLFYILLPCLFSPAFALILPQEVASFPAASTATQGADTLMYSIANSPL